MASWIDKLDPLKIFSSLNPPNLIRELRWVGWVQLGGQRFSLLFFFFSDTWTKPNMILRVFQFLLPLPNSFSASLTPKTTYFTLYSSSLSTLTLTVVLPPFIMVAFYGDWHLQQDSNGSDGSNMLIAAIEAGCEC